MNRITNEQRKAIVRNAVAQRDAALTGSESPADLRTAIMKLPCDPPGWLENSGEFGAYTAGHSDARHAAAELVSAAAAQVSAPADESPAELALRSLASWLGVGGYNAPTVDAALFETKIREGVTIYSQLHGIAARDLAEQVLHMDMVTDKGIRARELARRVLGITPLPAPVSAAVAAPPEVSMPLEDAQMLLSWMDETFGNDGGDDWFDADAAAVGDALGEAIKNFQRMRAALATPAQAVPQRLPLTEAQAKAIHSHPFVRDALLQYVDRPCDKEAADVVRVITNAANGLMLGAPFAIPAQQDGEQR